ncbi:DNA polymerase IV [Pseudoflavonifractor phocaeensis]|uniref:DNA polymerase IV n=1 Tax=Pseudoflavonifractor phocaeensis TaxID=1870988 RepID=UPI00195AB953|nr:DNA polymerase IV [Pseudoflavonifractor phocaeensis]MBM6925989.1 DNA polymerase IV [Pseudoflavonifractor phocaeensis]
MDRVILHCDLNSFYASVELLEHPELCNRPVAVCGDPESRHGIILAKNEPAKKYKVQTAETIWQARRKCPDLVLLPAHHWKYRAYSGKVNRIYERYTDLVEPFSIDESWLDVTGTLHLFGGNGKALADEIRRVVREELGLTLSVGVSFNKVFAKMGSDYKKPDATTLITRENFQQLLWPLPVTDLLFVGKAAANVLNGYGIRTIGDLARFDRDSLGRILGKGGYTLHDYATGREHAPVLPAREMPGPKSVGNGLTYPRNLTGWEELRTALSELADEVAARLRKHGLKATTLQLTIRDPGFKDICRQKRLSAPTYVSRDLTQCAMELAYATWQEQAPVRALTITAQNLVEEKDAGEQLDLFAAGSIPRRDKLEKLEKAMDSIRDRYGRSAITLASAVHSAEKDNREDSRLPPTE